MRQARADDMAKTVAVSFIHTCIDYANFLTYGSTNIKKLQRVLTPAAGVLFTTTGIYLDSNISMTIHVSKTVSSCYCSSQTDPQCQTLCH